MTFLIESLFFSSFSYDVNSLIKLIARLLIIAQATYGDNGFSSVTVSVSKSLIYVNILNPTSLTYMIIKSFSSCSDSCLNTVLCDDGCCSSCCLSLSLLLLLSLLLINFASWFSFFIYFFSFIIYSIFIIFH